MDRFFTIIVSAAFGALASILVSWGQGWNRRRCLWNNLKVVDVQVHHNKVAIRMKNSYVLPLTECCGYITLKYDQADIMAPPANCSAVITPEAPLLVEEERLCWSAHFPTQNPAKVDIYSGETHGLEVFQFDPGAPWLALLTEKYAEPCRVFLKGGRRYDGHLRIVSKETKSKSWDIEIDLTKENKLRVLGDGREL